MSEEKKDNPQVIPPALAEFGEWLKADPAHWISFLMLIIAIITLIVILVRRR